jgi:peroxiredoxin
LKAGTSAPTFELPDLAGRPVCLTDERGRRVLLVFSDPECGPCDVLLPDLARLEREHRENGLAVVMVGRGDPEENRRKAEAFGVEFPVVLQPGWRLSKQYGIFVTPVAFLIDEEGVIERDVARGPTAILELAREALSAERRVPIP